MRAALADLGSSWRHALIGDSLPHRPIAAAPSRQPSRLHPIAALRTAATQRTARPTPGQPVSTVKVAALAPMPTAKVITTISGLPGEGRRACRSASRFTTHSLLGSQRLGRIHLGGAPRGNEGRQKADAQQKRNHNRKPGDVDLRQGLDAAGKQPG